MINSNYLWRIGYWLRGHRIRSKHFFLPPDHPKPEVTPGTLEDYFWNNEGPIVQKWLHYLPVYEKYLRRYVGTPVRFLEIGVFRGGSLQLWRKYLGDDAILYGIDIEPSCKALDGQSGQVRIGSQDDPEFLKSVIEEMGGVDVVLDDGSHDSRHIRASLDALFPRLSEGGLYIVEDLHCSYWPNWSGGYRRRGAFLETVKTMIDDMHHWYHKKGQRIEATRDHLAAMHIHDSIIVFEKQKTERPSHIRVGQE